MDFSKSFEYLARAKEIIPGQSQTFSKSWKYFPFGVSPVYLKSGYGSHVFDIDGNEYIDFILGLGAITLGYHYPKVDLAIREQLRDGIIFGLPHPLEVELSELLVETIPCAEMVRFFKTGSEACQASIRVARAYTGRDGIIYRGYHGWSDWYAVTTEKVRGIPLKLVTYVLPFEYNNIDSLEEAFWRHHHDVAAVIMEPMIVEPPKDGFLQQVKDLTHTNGAVLIFDEVVTGFRWALGGAQKYFGVAPDIAVFGKGMANGMPLSAVVGGVDIMGGFEDVMVSSTFGGECLSLVAGVSTIGEMKEKHTIQHCWEMGTRLMVGLSALGINTIGYPCRPMILLEDDSTYAKSLLLQELIKRGILLHSGLLVNFCYSHTTEDIDTTLNAFEDALKNIKAGKVKLEGELVQSAFRRL